MRELEPGAYLRGRGRIRETRLDRPEHQRQRRAKLVAHIGEERGLGPVDLGQSLRPATIGLFLLGVGDGRRELRGDEIEEPPITVIERAARGHADDEHRDARERPLPLHGQHQSL